jgi:hypothetical protein
MRLAAKFILFFAGTPSSASGSGGGGGGVALQSDFANTATTEAWVFW